MRGIFQPSFLRRSSGRSAALLVLVFASSAFALPRAGMVEAQPSAGAFCLADAGKTPPICVDASDFPGVARAAGDLAQDIGRVTGTAATVVRSTDALPMPPVLVGTLGKSAAVDKLVAAGKLDVAAIRGQWESYVIQTVADPMPGVSQALVIVGSDKRGTIYGLYDVSENIGVSPWYWWADVPVTHRDAVYVKAGRIVQGPPAVKYRGIFINDEAPCLSGWSKEKFGGPNSRMYTHMFELLLRLRANYLWPAMWGNAFNEDDPENPRLADEYGIVMGTSHQEPMLRAQAEFDRRFKPDLWNYATHPDVMEKFWREGVRRNKDYESMITIGMRGRNDTEMLEHATIEQSAALLEKIVGRQRQILSEEVNPDVTKIPQMWCLYKEVQDYYEHGLRVPDDVTLLWAEDNWGNLRRVPTAEERERSGGAGIYYHFDYVGSPRNYKWLNTNALPKVQEQMNIAYQYGADRIWIANVGDLKPMELPIDFFMTMAWNPPAMTKDKVADYTRQWAAREFGADHADEIADIVSRYAKYNGWHKPELVSPSTYSLLNYGEADRMEAAWADLVSRAEAVNARLRPEQRDAYFELVLYPTKASATVTDLYIAAARNALYASQGRIEANAQADRVRALFQQDKDLTAAYHHVAGGKWDHMMDQVRIGYTSWNDPKTNIMPAVKQVTPRDGAALGVAVEGSDHAWPGAADTAALPPIDTLADQHRWIDVFRRGTQPVKFTAAASASWLKVDPAAGDTSRDTRLTVRVDWAAVPAGQQEGTVTIAADNGESVAVRVPVLHDPRAAEQAKGVFASLTESFAIPAAATARNVAATGVQWEAVPDYGRVPSAMEVFPVTAASVMPPDHAPCLEYAAYLPAGDVPINAVLGPTLPFVAGRGLRLALSVDDGAPQMMDAKMTPTWKDKAWDQAVRDNARTLTFTQHVAAPGRHTIKVWMVDPGVVLQQLIVGQPRPSFFGPPARVIPPPAG